MIVKNEESILARCLDTVADLMDEIIIVDTGSTDRTKEIAAKYTDKIYDFQWIDDFSAARNFSFSKATMDYIYAPDADEILDEENRTRFKILKKCMLPEIEMVQMKYVTVSEDGSLLNAKKEYRPKLFKRLRTYTWIDPIHETVRIDPVVFNSDIEIIHKPLALHGKRDFRIFLKEYAAQGKLSDKLYRMYAQQLLKMGEPEDFIKAYAIFQELWQLNPLSDRGKEAACVLARHYRLSNDPANLFKYALRDMMETPCSEMCYDLGAYYQAQGDYDEAIVWYLNAAYETVSIIDIHCSGDLPLQGLVHCYKELAAITQNPQYQEMATHYDTELSQWQMPEEL
ncbi:MAG: glycosyltransferase family 2 protein [Lachnospiraceae bacterium]|nr:glycosyltransferase family 2 protein [Lachnospiraceae bacterium]